MKKIILIILSFFSLNAFFQFWGGVDALYQRGELVGFVFVCGLDSQTKCLEERDDLRLEDHMYVEHFCLYKNYEYLGRGVGRLTVVEDRYSDIADIDQFLKKCQQRPGATYAKSVVDYIIKNS